MKHTVTVVNHMTHGIQIHKVGCADILREVKKRHVNNTFDIEIPDGAKIAETVAADINDGFGWTAESGEPEPWPASMLHVMPCCKRS